MWAAIDDRADAVRALAEAGADLNVVSKVTAYPHTPPGVAVTGLEEGVSYVGQTVLPKGGWTAAMFAAREGAVGAVRCARRRGCESGPRRSRRHLGAHHRHHQRPLRRGIALLEKGADPNLADIKGMTPLYAAVDMHTVPTNVRPA